MTKINFYNDTNILYILYRSLTPGNPIENQNIEIKIIAYRIRGSKRVYNKSSTGRHYIFEPISKYQLMIQIKFQQHSTSHILLKGRNLHTLFQGSAAEHSFNTTNELSALIYEKNVIFIHKGTPLWVKNDDPLN